MALTSRMKSALNDLAKYIPALGKDRTEGTDIKLGDKLDALQKGIGKVKATVGAEAANAIEVACELQDMDGEAIKEARVVRVETLAVTDGQGDIAEAAAPIGTLIDAANPAAGPNVAYFETDADGKVSFSVANTAAEETGVIISADGCAPKLVKLTFA